MWFSLVMNRWCLCNASRSKNCVAMYLLLQQIQNIAFERFIGHKPDTRKHSNTPRRRSSTEPRGTAMSYTSKTLAASLLCALAATSRTTFAEAPAAAPLAPEFTHIDKWLNGPP